MASRTSISVAKRRPFVRGDKRQHTLNKSIETETFLVFNYDNEYFRRYALFFDRIKEACQKHDLDSILVNHLEHVLSPYAVVNNDLAEAMGCTDYTESIIDDIYGIAGHVCADDILEIVVEFANDPVKPEGFQQVKDLLINNPTFFLMDFYPHRQDDALVYVVANGESE